MVKATKNSVVTVLLSLWSLCVVTIYVVMVIVLIRSDLALPLLLGPTAFAGAMVCFGVLLLRWNNMGEESLTVSQERVGRERWYHPMGAGKRNLERNSEPFVLWRPYQLKETQFDYEFWGLGPWSLGLRTASGKRIELLRRLTKAEGRHAGEVLSKAGYDVHGLEEDLW